MTADPATRFWLDWAETHGAACEPGADTCLLLLPDELQLRFGLPEECVITSEPEVAREDGAALVTAGHAFVREAADEVLAAGDVGRVRLPPRQAVLPTPDALVQKAREQFPVDHGRLALCGEPEPRIFSLLRLGALVTFQLSAHDRVQERCEVWTDIETSAVLPPRVWQRLITTASDATEPGADDLPERTATALTAAARALEAQATKRADELAKQNDAARRSEVDRTNSYYDALLANLAHREQQATPERRHVYQARADATRVERDRRLAEIDERFTPVADVRPFRLHLISVPGCAVPIDIQRGARRYPFSLAWLGPGAGYIPRLCPACSADAVLVAGKQGLGCRHCLGPTESVRHEPARVVPGRPEPPPPELVAKKAGAAVQRRPSIGRRPPADPLTQIAVPAKPDERRLIRAGNQLAVDFWQSVADGDRKQRRQTWPDGPLAALRRLYGAAGPHVAIGLGAGERLNSVEAQTWPRWPVIPTVCRLQTNRAEYALTMRWRIEGGRSLIVELVPAPDAISGMLPGLLISSAPDVHARLLAPEFRINPEDHDPVAAWLLAEVLPRDGVPLLARCLAAWWAGPPTDFDNPGVTAAALRYEVGRRSGCPITYAALGGEHQVDEGGLRRVVARIRTSMRSVW